MEKNNQKRLKIGDIAILRATVILGAHSSGIFQIARHSDFEMSSKCSSRSALQDRIVPTYNVLHFKVSYADLGESFSDFRERRG